MVLQHLVACSSVIFSRGWPVRRKESCSVTGLSPRLEYPSLEFGRSLLAKPFGRGFGAERTTKTGLGEEWWAALLGWLWLRLRELPTRLSSSGRSVIEPTSLTELPPELCFFLLLYCSRSLYCSFPPGCISFSSSLVFFTFRCIVTIWFTSLNGKIY